jgi:hypothetical protein
MPWTWAEQRLKRSHNYWITTVKPDGSPHTMVVWGLWQNGRFLFSTGSKSRKARNLAENANCIVCTEHASEAVIVEGTAEIAEVRARRKFLPTYERKYKFDMKGNGAGHSVDERAGFCSASTLGVCSVGKALRRKVHALEVRIKHFESSFNGLPNLFRLGTA